MNFEKSSTNTENPEYRERLEFWRKIKKHLSEYTRDDPEGLDEGTKELAVGLNAIGLDTRFSCEGHFKGVGRVTRKGYVDNNGKEHLKEIENPPLEGEWNNPYVGFLLNLPIAITEQERRIKEEKERKMIGTLQSLIDEYYQEREVLPEIRVRIQKDESRYSDYIVTVSDTENTEAVSGTEDYKNLERRAVERLEGEQQEILEFSEFLKKKYLETGLHL